MESVAERYRRLASLMNDRIAAVPDEAWAGPTPCEQWTVRDLVGHLLDVRDAYSAHMGRGNVVMHDSAKGVNFGASDPRGDGAAVVEMQGTRDQGNEGPRK